MVTKHRAATEQKFWDAIVLALAGECFKVGPEGCAQAIREIADALLVERRRSQQQDKA